MRGIAGHRVAIDARVSARRMCAALSVTALLTIAACAGGPARTHVVDLSGAPADPFARADARATVLLFIRTDCPISNRYAPEVRRLYETFSARNVDFFLVYPGPAGPPESIREHTASFDLPIPPLLDPEFELVALVEATVTPEVAVFTPDGELAYRGRIDDRYVDFGKSRAEPNRRDLEEALTAVLEGRAVEEPRTRAVGCYIQDLG